jgi:hypothetical protein
MRCPVHRSNGEDVKTRFREHFFKIKNNSKFNNFIYQHFKLTGHDINNISVQPIEQLTFENGTVDSYKTKARCTAELEWIKICKQRIL